LASVRLARTCDQPLPKGWGPLRLVSLFKARRNGALHIVGSLAQIPHLINLRREIL
jgi:hypothetical protein